MKDLFSGTNIQINKSLYIKDPSVSELGTNIVRGSIQLIDKLGFQDFTFRKLSLEIGTTEASIYRYFENKNKLLLYLINWYWGCIKTRISSETEHLESPALRLKKAIHILTTIPRSDTPSVFSVELALKTIIINESAKVVLTKDVDHANSEGVFLVYKEVVQGVAELIKEINNNYPYSNMLVSSMIEGSNQQHFFAKHLPRLTNNNHEKDTIESFYMDLIFKAIRNE
jgi:AcrR family transcriptional regulator